MEIETKEKPHILHFQVKNTGFCQQSETFTTVSVCFYVAEIATFSCRHYG